MKKIVALLLTLMLFMAVVPLTGLAEGEKKVNQFGWEVPEETIKFTVYRGKASPDDYAKYTPAFRQYVLENFNVDIEVLVYENDATERLNLMLASNDYPDVIICSVLNSARWLEQKRAVDLTDYIANGSVPNLTARYGNYLQRYYSEDGHIYALGNGWGMSQWADYAPQFRLDWYKELGEPAFSTPEEYYEVVKQMVEKHPTNSKGEKTYAFGGYIDEPNYSVMRTWLSMFGIKKFWQYDESNNMTYWPFTDAGRDMVKFLNNVNQDGLLDPDIFSMKIEEFGDRVTNERYAAFVGNWHTCGTYGHEKWINTYGDDYNINMRYYHVNVHPQGVTPYYNFKNTNGSRVLITDKAKDVEGILRWLDFESTELGTRLVGYGIPNVEGSVWNVNDDGTWEWNEAQREIITTDTSKFDWEAMRLIGGQGYFVINAGVEPLSDGTYYWYDQSNVDDFKKQKDANLAGTFYDSGAFDAIVLPSDSLLPSIKTSCDNITMTALANAIYAASEEEAMTLIDKACDDLKAAGIDQLTSFYQEAYQKTVAAWGME